MKRFAAGFASLTPLWRGALWMIVASACFSLSAVAVRHLTAEIHPFEISFFRGFFGVIFMLPWLRRAGIRVLATGNHKAYFVRGLLSAGATFCWFYALAIMPVGDATAVSFTMPLITAVLAVVLLHERMNRYALAGVIIGFIGMLIMLRPGIAEFNLGVGLVLLQSVFVALVSIIIKVATRTDRPDVIAMYQILYMTPMTLIPSLFFWSWPTWEGWFWTLFVAASSLYAQRAMTRGLAEAPAGAMQPFDFLRLPFAIVFGFIAFSELPDIWSALGAAVIFGASFLSVRRSPRMQTPA
jgi:drug/metabolite transporter (DMT)-like permease